MKTLGLIGGLSWFSTEVYYRKLNELIGTRLGDNYSAKILLYSLNFKDFRILQEKDDWDQIEILLSDIALRLEKAGADCIVICTNTPHLVADGIQKKISIPLIHIAEETAKHIQKQSINEVGLLGTKFTMEQAFFKERLTRYGIETIIPSSIDRDFIHTSIFTELTKGVFKNDTKKKIIDIISSMQDEGAQGIIFGCTELALLIKAEEYEVKIFDTTSIHAAAAVDFALKQ